jgi:uncharacterized protein YbbC (DUF1343 family)
MVDSWYHANPNFKGVLMFRLIVVALSLLCLSDPAAAKIKLGVDVLRDEQFKSLEGLRVGVVVNPASVDSDLTPTALLLHRADNVNLVALFGPEHGVWGDEYAGDKIDDKTDPVTGLKAFSLYGKTRKPTPEMLANLDVVVFDLQDIGSRSYTYISTMKVVLEACAEQNKRLVILDRPNPLGGLRIEGGPVEPGYESFVSFLDVPYLHGMTMGELAMMVKSQVAKDWNGLSVIRLQGWTREMVWQDTGLRWVPTSPHVPHASSVAAYAATGIVGELGQMSNGVGYTLPFEIVGDPGVDGTKLADTMNRVWPGHAGVHFRAIRFKPFYATNKGEVCQGVQVHLDPRTAPSLIEINYRLLEALDAPAQIRATTRPTLFDKAAGSDAIKKALDAGEDLEPVFRAWRAHSEQFRADRKPWLLYE